MSYNIVYNNGFKKPWNNVKFETVEAETINGNSYPAASPNSVLSTDGSGNVSWAPAAAGTIPGGAPLTVLIRDNLNTVTWSDAFQVVDGTFTGDLTVNTINGSAYPPPTPVTGLTAGPARSIVYTDALSNVNWSTNPSLATALIGSLTSNVINVTGGNSSNIDGNLDISGNLLISGQLETFQAIINFGLEYGSRLQSANFTLPVGDPWPATGTEVNQSYIGSQAVYGKVGQFDQVSVATSLDVPALLNVTSINGQAYSPSSGTNPPSSAYQVYASDNSSAATWTGKIQTSNLPVTLTPGGAVQNNSVMAVNSAGNSTLTRSLFLTNLSIGTTSPLVSLSFSNCVSAALVNEAPFQSASNGNFQSLAGDYATVSCQRLGRTATLTISPFNITAFQAGANTPFSLCFLLPQSSYLNPSSNPVNGKYIGRCLFRINGSLVNSWMEVVFVNGVDVVRIWSNETTATFTSAVTTLSSDWYNSMTYNVE